MKRKLISGIIVTMFLVTMVTFAIPVRVSADTGEDIIMGIIGPEGWIQWDGIVEGAEMAKDLINDEGGMKDSGGTYHKLKFVEIDEHAVPVPDPTAAVTDLLTALENNPTMQFLIGGFQGECVLPMREAAMDYAAVHGRPIWIVCGSSDDIVIDDGPDSDNPYDDVREDYERYKYMFRSDPMNSSALGFQLFAMLGMLQVPKLKAIYGIAQEDPLPAYLIGEDLHWCDEIFALLNEYAPLLGYEVVGIGRPSAIETDFAPFLDAIESSGAKLIIDIFSCPAGAVFIRQWGERKVPVVVVGINVESQMHEFYASIGGKCEYETLMSALGTKTNLIPYAEPLTAVEFWEQYSERYEHAPIYNAWGVFIHLMRSNETAANWIGKSCDEIIPILEEDEFDTLLGYFKYTDYHDLFCDAWAMTPIWPSHGNPAVPLVIEGESGTVRAHIPQWQSGRLEVVWPRGWTVKDIDPEETPLPWARKWKIPPWVYCLAETDFAGSDPIPIPTEALAAEFGAEPGDLGYFTAPDGEVGSDDMNTVTGAWQKVCPWSILEADMDGNQFIDIDDVARVALDWGKTIATC